MRVDDASQGLKLAIISAAREASRAGLMPASQGNISARDPGSGHIIITPHDQPYDDMLPEDLVVVDQEARRISGDHEPSFDVEVHCTVYRERQDVHSVIHTEPVYTNAFGATGQDIAPVTTTGLKSANGVVPVMPYRAPRDRDFALAMLAVMGARHAVVWANHGLLVVGGSVRQALDRTLGVEFNAHVLHAANSVGTPLVLAYRDASMVVA
jgi:ribulose-5-phosphate 4-epimerase/fuculose-1-phosphate aldolase